LINIRNKQDTIIEIDSNSDISFQNLASKSFEHRSSDNGHDFSPSKVKQTKLTKTSRLKNSNLIKISLNKIRLHLLLDINSDSDSAPVSRPKVSSRLYALVKWLEEKTYTVLLTSNVILGKEKCPIVGNIYKIRYNSQTFDATVLKVGNQLDCENQLNTICNYTEELNKKKRKLPVAQVSDPESIDGEMIDQLKSIIKERDNYIQELTIEVNNLKKHAALKSLEFENLSESLNVCDKQKFIVLAKSILTGLATTQDLLDLAVRSTNDDHKMVLKIVHIGFFI
jgi:hypothetical protein